MTCLFGLVLIFTVTSAFAASDSSLFEKGNAAYQTGDFKSAISDYESLVKGGDASGAVYYNLGDAYIRSGQKGRAMLNYLRALRRIPRDPDLRWNYSVLKNALPDKIDPAGSVLTNKLKRFARRFTTSEAAVSFSLALAVFALLAFLDFIFVDGRRWLPVLRVLTLVWIVLAGALLAFKAYEAKDPRIVVLQKEVTAHYGPSLKETKAFVLHEGTEARVLDETKDWSYVYLANGTAGWIPDESFEKV